MSKNIKATVCTVTFEGPRNEVHQAIKEYMESRGQSIGEADIDEAEINPEAVEKENVEAEEVEIDNNPMFSHLRLVKINGKEIDLPKQSWNQLRMYLISQLYGEWVEKGNVEGFKNFVRKYIGKIFFSEGMPDRTHYQIADSDMWLGGINLNKAFQEFNIIAQHLKVDIDVAYGWNDNNGTKKNVPEKIGKSATKHFPEF